MFPAAGWNARLFVGRDKQVVSAQWSALPNAMVQIEDRSDLSSLMGSRGKTQLDVAKGAKASLLTQRHNLAPRISATRP